MERSLHHPLSGVAMPPRLSRLAMQAVVGALFVAVYAALDWMSFIHEYKDVPITPWNPGLGIVFGLMLRDGPRYILVLFAGVAIGEVVLLENSLPWPAILGVSAAIAGGYGAVAFTARHVFRLDADLNSLRDVFVLLGAGIAGACLAVALLSAFLLLDSRLAWAEVPLIALPLVVGDAIGIAVMAPLALRANFLLRTLPARQVIELVVEFLLYGAFLAVVLPIIVGGETTDGFKYFYLLFLPVVAAAVRHGLDGSCIGLALAQFGLVALLHGHGYEVEAFTEFQLLMLVLTATGLVVGVIVSERRNVDRRARDAEARLKEKEAQAAQAARVSLVGGMASALAHEINQPMTAARALARSVQEILRTPSGDAQRADGNLSAMIAQIDHAAAVVRRMHQFLRRGRPRLSTISLREMLGDALALIQADVATPRVQIDLDVPGDLPYIHGDSVHLQQVVLNLIRNALDALAAEPPPAARVVVRVRQLEAPLRLEIAVLDNGPGIPPELRQRLFEPLTTSKPEGLGLGLSICAAIVEAHGGRIWLESAVAGATEFRFSLPVESAITQ
jgi:two-component system, LuxR family, sensor kinase FixL